MSFEEQLKTLWLEELNPMVKIDLDVVNFQILAEH